MKIQEGEEDVPSSHGKKPAKQFTTRCKLLIASTIIILVAIVVVIVVIVLSKKDKDTTPTPLPSRKSIPITLDDVHGGFFRYETKFNNWLSDDEYLFKESRSMYIHSRKTKTKKEILPASVGFENGVSYSNDRKFLLFYNNSTPLYRHSFFADYYVKNIITGDIKKVEPSQLRYAGWSTKGNALVMVHESNIYYIPTADNLKQQIQLTFDREPNNIFNGVPDWVYEEEILFSTHAMEFSTNGSYLAYGKFNATQVPYFSYPYYDAGKAYTTIKKIAYPKAGFPNPDVEIRIVNLATLNLNANQTQVENVTYTIQVPTKFINSEHYYAIMSWYSDVDLFVQWMNRRQNESECAGYNAQTQEAPEIYQSHFVTNGWIDSEYASPWFSADGSYYITTAPKHISDETGSFRHLIKVSTNKSEESFLTSGEFTVIEVSCFNQDKEIIYFKSTEKSPRHRNIYAYNVTSKTKECITCALIEDPKSGDACTYYSASFSHQCTWATINCLGPIVPISIMYNLLTREQEVITNNTRTRNNMKLRDIPIRHFYTIESDEFRIPVMEIRPVDFDPDKRYGILFDVYGGPGTQKVNDRFSMNLAMTFPANDVIAVCFDARGTGYRGFKHMHAVYRKLGHYESVDAINLAKHLRKQSYVDPDRIGIWGWSYGGFYSSSVLSQPQNNVIKTAVAVAPVTDWKFYDTVYTERYMGLPSKEDNQKGYTESSVLNRAKNFAGKNFLLIHGTADDNVHFQNAVALTDVLISNNIKFRNQYFPDQRHGIARTNKYVYKLISDYLLAHLKPK